MTPVFAETTPVPVLQSEGPQVSRVKGLTTDPVI